MIRLGLNIHTSGGIKASQTVAVYFPSRSKTQFYNKNDLKCLLFLKLYSSLDITPKDRKAVEKYESHS